MLGRCFHSPPIFHSSYPMLFELCRLIFQTPLVLNLHLLNSYFPQSYLTGIRNEINSYAGLLSDLCYIFVIMFHVNVSVRVFGGIIRHII